MPSMEHNNFRLSVFNGTIVTNNVNIVVKASPASHHHKNHNNHNRTSRSNSNSREEMEIHRGNNS